MRFFIVDIVFLRKNYLLISNLLKFKLNFIAVILITESNLNSIIGELFTTVEKQNVIPFKSH